MAIIWPTGSISFKRPSGGFLLETIAKRSTIDFPKNWASVSDHHSRKVSISLSVKDLETSRQFYENFGFKVFGGNASKNWLISGKLQWLTSSATPRPSAKVNNTASLTSRNLPPDARRALAGARLHPSIRRRLAGRYE